MSRSRHTEAQMIAALKQVEAGRAVEDVAREVGVSKHTIYGWKAKYGGMDVPLRRSTFRDLGAIFPDFKDPNSSLSNIVTFLPDCPLL